MKISLITPADKRSANGNKATAVRWAKILEDLGHSVDYLTAYDDRPADMMISLHAWRTATSATRFKELYPDRPLVVALTGTDINEFQYSHPETTLHTMKIADKLVCLHDLAIPATPKRFWSKLDVIYQSAKPLPQARKPSQRYFDVCVVGHLREVKDPLRTAYAVRSLPKSSRIRVTHYGKAHTPAWAKKATTEMARNPRFTWKGEVPSWKIRRVYGTANLMVISSLNEGGANVVSEAIVAGLPVIGSDIPGNVGLLADDYPGVFPVRDTRALRDLLLRAEQDKTFLDDLTGRCKSRAPMFRPEAEKRAWAKLVKSL